MIDVHIAVVHPFECILDVAVRGIDPLLDLQVDYPTAQTLRRLLVLGFVAYPLPWHPSADRRVFIGIAADSVCRLVLDDSRSTASRTCVHGPVQQLAEQVVLVVVSDVSRQPGAASCRESENTSAFRPVEPPVSG